MRVYCLISESPIFYISATSVDLLKSDYQYLVEDTPDEYLSQLNITEVLEYNPLLFDELRKCIRQISGGKPIEVWTLVGTSLAKHNFGALPYLYPKDLKWEMPTYSGDLSLVSDYYSLYADDLAKAASSMIQLNRHDDIHAMLTDYNKEKRFPDKIIVSPDMPSEKQEGLLGYICIPIVAEQIALKQ